MQDFIFIMKYCDIITTSEEIHMLSQMRRKRVSLNKALPKQFTPLQSLVLLEEVVPYALTIVHCFSNRHIPFDINTTQHEINTRQY